MSGNPTRRTRSIFRGHRSLARLPLPALLAVILVQTIGCSGPRVHTLMDTPVLYHGAAIDPFAHLGDDHRSTTLSVFYATNRRPQEPEGDGIGYGNGKDSALRLGHASVRFGDGDFRWEDLYAASIAPHRDVPVPVSIAEVRETAALPDFAEFRRGSPLTEEQKAFAAAIDSDLGVAKDKEIMVYVHGTKVDFANSVVMTAEVDHFAGRDFVGVAFSWPSHQNILHYLLGVDVTRAQDSSRALRTLLEFLAEHTNAERINLLSYSAGGRVVSKALHELRSAYPDWDPERLRGTFRIGAVVFAAADIPMDAFRARLPSIADLCQQVVVTVSDHDPALIAAKEYMGGGVRVGQESAEEAELSLMRSLGITNFEVVDLSLSQEGRGFDIVGHHYWYRHPWASSDIVLLMRTNLPPLARGLSPSELEGVFYLSPDYPERVREAARARLGGSW